MDGRAIFYFLTRTGPVAAQSCMVLRYTFCSSFDPRESEHSNPRNVYLNEGRMVVAYATLAQ